MEGETEGSIATQLRLFHDRVLPPLEENILCGNSLIDLDYYDSELDFGEERKIKPFSWQKSFPEAFAQGGFDCVIGNPPYVRMQTISKAQTDYFKRHFGSAVYGNYDLYVLFIELSLKIINPSGLTGMILPHKFFQAEYGQAIRSFIETGNHLLRINDFTTNQVFTNATTYTCLLFLSKSFNNSFDYQRIELGNQLPQSLFTTKTTKILSHKLQGKWNLKANGKEAIFEKLHRNKTTLKEISRKIFKGSSTGNDHVYLVKLISRKAKHSQVYSPALDENIKIENNLLKPYIYGSDVRKFYINPSDVHLIFPYRVDEAASLIDHEEMMSTYPLTMNYFMRVKKLLSRRKLDFTGIDFYKYSAGRSLVEYNQKKILIPDLLVESRIGLDTHGEYFHGPAIHSVILNEQYKNLHTNYIVALLASKLFWFFISMTSTALRGNAYRLTPEYINSFPIKLIDPKNKSEIQQQATIIKTVDQLLRLNQEFQAATLPNQKKQIQSKIGYYEDRINAVVYELYGLTEEDIKIIEAK